MAAWRPLLDKFGSGNLPFICLRYKDKEGVQHNIPAVYVGKLSSSSVQKIMNMVSVKNLEFLYISTFASANTFISSAILLLHLITF